MFYLFNTFFVLLLVLAQSCLATTIVVIRTPKHLVVGADSLIVNWPVPETVQNFYTCKLHKQHSMFFVIQGMGVVHRKSNFSAEVLAREAISSSKSLKEAAVQFVRSSSIPYGRVMKDFKIHDPHGWRLVAQQHGTGIPLIVIFFGLEAGIPKYVVAGLRVSETLDPAVSADVTSCPGSACEGLTESALVVGQSQEAYRQIGADDSASLAKFRQGRGDQRTVETIIALEEKAVPDSVGGPIRVVTVDAEGEHWVPETATCR